jgi:hypothetical protein
MTFPKGGSEYGGYPDLIQPEPHDVSSSASEQLMLTYLTEPTDPSSTIEKVADEIRVRGAQNRGRYND